MKSSKIVTLFFAIAPLFVSAQFSKPEIDLNEEEGYLYPIYPGKPGSLAGTMGELRQTHFHSGIDIRTNNMTGYPVLASKSGYISRVTTGPAGYGNIIYITHPDKYTTLYAHLDRFRGALAQRVLEEQYKAKSGSVDLYFEPDLFKVKQGDTIALSGNSGSSGGPHLHFDIRDPHNIALDPLKVAAFPEVIDKLPPAPEKIALRTLDINSRINDKFGRFEFYAATRSGNNYSIASPILVSGTFGIEIIAKDRLAPGSPFWGGVNYIDVKLDGKPVFNQAIEKIDITEPRAIYTLMDFKTMRNQGTRFYKLYIEDGNTLKFYGKSPGNGKITIDSTRESKIDITLRDSYGNSSTVSFNVKPSPKVQEVKTLEAMPAPFFADLYENTYMVSSKVCTDTTDRNYMYAPGVREKVTPAYGNANRSVYLFDLRKVIPDSISICGNTIIPKIRQAIPSGTEYKYYSTYADLVFPEKSLYDTLYLHTDYNKLPDGTEVFLIGNKSIPINKSISVSLKPQQNYTLSPSLAVYRTAGKGYSYVGGEWVNGRVNFTTREFGEFTILQDLVPPTIRVIAADRVGARFKIRDDLSGIARFEASLNGKFLLMHYDAKSATIWSEQLDKKVPFRGAFELVVIDNAGNKATFTKTIQ